MHLAPKFSWRPAPFARLFLALGCGIFAGYHWILPAWHDTAWGAILLLVLALGAYRYTQAMHPRLNYTLGAALLLWVSAFGVWRVQAHYQVHQTDHFSQLSIYHPDSTLLWAGTVVDRSENTERARLRVRIHAVSSMSSSPVACSGQLLLYVPNDILVQQLIPGQRLQFPARADALSQPLNPDAFDFSAWQAQRNVFHQARIGARQWLAVKSPPSLRRFAWKSRERLITILRTYMPVGTNELAVAFALILGKRDEISTEVLNAYSETGAVHVLSVSGLHLGFVAGGLGWLLNFGPFRRRSWRWGRLGIMLVGIWSFSLLTGMAPSVMRAATMFSFLLLGQAIGRRASVYNSLAASAFLLLVIDPFLLFDVGFQLSYLALLGIVFFQPKIYAWFFVPNKPLDYIWNLTSVSIAAQLTTFPISLYYFHQFPLYFMLTGMVVVVASSFILGLGILLFFTSIWPPLAHAIGWLLDKILWFNNAFIFQVQKLPGHLATGIWIDAAMLALLYLSLLSIAIYTTWQRPRWLMAGLGLLACMLTLNVTQQLDLRQQRRWVVYHQYKATVIDAMYGTHRYTISTLDETDPALGWGITPHRQRRSVRWQEQSGHWLVAGRIYGFDNHTLALVDDTFTPSSPPTTPMQVDAVVVTSSPRMSLATLQRYFRSNHWVFDGSNYPSKVRKWQAEADSLGIATHWTAEQGAFIQEFQE